MTTQKLLLHSALIKQTFFLMLVLKLILQSYLDRRQMSSIKNNRHQVPMFFKDHLSLADHQKAADYNLMNLRFGVLFRLINTIVLLYWCFGHGVENLLAQISQFPITPFWQGLALIVLFGIIDSVFGLPQDLIKTFYIEEKFGMNKTTLKLYIIDMIKNFFISMILLVPLLTMVLAIINYLGTYWWIIAWSVIIIFQLTMFVLYPSLIAPLFNKFTPLPEGEVADRIKNLLLKVDFQSNGLFVMDASKRTSHSNAYFTGLSKAKRIVFYDTLIKMLTPIEVEAVLAHELGHFKKKHILKMMVGMILFSFIFFYFISIVIQIPEFYQSFGIKNINTSAGFILISLMTPLFTFYFTPIAAWFSRRHEFEADRFAMEYSDHKALSSSLLKMYKENFSTLTPDEVYSSFYYSHPPAIERLTRLRAQNEV